MALASIAPTHGRPALLIVWGSKRKFDSGDPGDDIKN
jgi:hypothetical protein